MYHLALNYIHRHFNHHLILDLSFGQVFLSELAVQSVVVVFEVFQLQEVSGPLAALLH